GPLADEERRLVDPFVRREPASTREAFAAAPDGRRFLREPRVDDLVVVGSAVRTTHEATVTPSLRPRAGPSVEARWRGSRPSDAVTAAAWRHGVGTATVSPATTVLVPSVRTIASTTGRTSWPGTARCAIDHNVSPGWTTTCCTCGSRSGAARVDPPSAAPARAIVSTRPRTTSAARTRRHR